MNEALRNEEELTPEELEMATGGATVTGADVGGQDGGRRVECPYCNEFFRTLSKPLTKCPFCHKVFSVVRGKASPESV
ncbi:MAG: hypothetical protein J5518_03875 [Lachnospiraceae bacterium]|nr:hypothetical protein [Lachnospiraceae bacterium]